ncbi:hypothetical protein CDG77_05425 [Nostoc sp. 'Peltigera membranacea cyanobiont' 213]|uniref:hypothetical protein n=1 Tax=Nostoc cyanobionts TaxID=3123326 RepID=UPI000B956611|nr:MULTISPECIES: hypothetical protein [unclassified Nostoc]AVH64378.1 hypothetical protein NPM_2732 [Nostoc sp. 'Peltigera membranacea cyanobiont' N6]OYD98575.1 hypothetical protein CDG77_05425 [Nostoc sp. 'Peltigera membranacea cyanobiont' 213]
MSENQEENPIVENVEPPEVKLTAPELFEMESTWLVVAKNRRVNRDWEALMQRHPENTRRCYEDLCTAPTTRQPGRVFPLKGKLYKGAWEYEVTKGDRVFYVPDAQQLKVVVYYAGKHPSPAPTP